MTISPYCCRAQQGFSSAAACEYLQTCRHLPPGHTMCWRDNSGCGHCSRQPACDSRLQMFQYNRRTHVLRCKRIYKKKNKTKLYLKDYILKYWNILKRYHTRGRAVVLNIIIVWTTEWPSSLIMCEAELHKVKSPNAVMLYIRTHFFLTQNPIKIISQTFNS